MHRVQLNKAEARRLALTSQGFGRRSGSGVSIRQVRKLAGRILAFQIDSVNVLVRAHYMPAFARLGPYPISALDLLAYEKRELFEYWGHAACLMPVSLYPLLRYRMHAEETLAHMRTPEGEYLARAYAEVAERGALSVSKLSDPGKRSGNWWGWSTGKIALERLYDAGLLAIAGRRGFERLYDLAERVIPPSALEAPAPGREDAMKELILLACSACGVGTAGDICGYFNVDGWRDRIPPDVWLGKPRTGRVRPVAKRLVAELVESGRLFPAAVEGWTEAAYVLPETRIPRSVDTRALVTPFDSLVWDRKRIERLFGMKYTISLYTPVDKREHGYYVCPFLLGDALVARCDLKADRQRGVLMVQSAFLEPGASASIVAPELLEELRLIQSWLELDAIEISDRGDELIRTLARI